MAESEEELKSLLMKVKKDSEKAGLKLNIWKTKIMASSPFTSWQIEGEKVETVTDFIRSEERRVGKEWKQWEILFSWTPKSLQTMTAAMK